MICWSDKSKPIEANGGGLSQIETYESLGLRIVETGRWMISATKQTDIKWEEVFKVVLPSKKQRK